MDRRTFIQHAGGACAAAFTAHALINNPLFAEDTKSASAPYDLVAVRGGEPAEMFARGIAALGGIGRFVKKGQTVLVKPNIGWAATPERAANTNPELVGAIVKACVEAGAQSVTVFDNTCNQWESCYSESGIEAAVQKAGGKMAQGNNERDYKEIELSGTKSLKKVSVHRLVLESDVFINVPVLKNHGGAKLSVSMKNLMGTVWDRRWWHKNNLQQCIADYLCQPRRPHLNVVDAYRIMMKNGPRGVSVEDTVVIKQQLLSTDMVAADAAAAKVFGTKAEDIPHIQIAHEMGLGRMDLEKLSIHKIAI